MNIAIPGYALHYHLRQLLARMEKAARDVAYEHLSKAIPAA